jgi:hypothetical protein
MQAKYEYKHRYWSSMKSDKLKLCVDKMMLTVVLNLRSVHEIAQYNAWRAKKIKPTSFRCIAD